MPVLITGAEGFIGSHLTRRLVREGARVSALVYPRASRERIADLEGKIKVFPIDIRDEDNLSHLVSEIKPRKIFHLAAVTDVDRSPQRLDQIISVNFGGTLNLLRALRRIKYEILICADTAEAYGNNPPPFREDMALDPVSPYSLSKAAATLLCKTWSNSFGGCVDILRLFLVYGPGQGQERFLPQLIRAGLSGRPFRMTAGEQTREYTYIDDVVEGFLRMAERGKGRGDVYNLGSGEEVSLRELVGKVERLLGAKIKLATPALPYRKNEIRRFVGDHTKIRDALGWQSSVDLASGLEKTVDWYKKTGDGVV